MQTIYEFSMESGAEDCGRYFFLRRNGIEKSAKKFSASEPSPPYSGHEVQLNLRLKGELVETGLNASGRYSAAL